MSTPFIYSEDKIGSEQCRQLRQRYRWYRDKGEIAKWSSTAVAKAVGTMFFDEHLDTRDIGVVLLMPESEVYNALIHFRQIRERAKA